MPEDRTEKATPKPATDAEVLAELYAAVERSPADYQQAVNPHYRDRLRAWEVRFLGAPVLVNYGRHHPLRLDAKLAQRTSWAGAERVKGALLWKLDTVAAGLAALTHAGGLAAESAGRPTIKWGRLTVLQQRIVRVLANATHELTRDAVLQQAGFSENTQSARAALKDLVEEGVAYHVGTRGGYRLEALPRNTPPDVTE